MCHAMSITPPSHIRPVYGGVCISSLARLTTGTETDGVDKNSGAGKKSVEASWSYKTYDYDIY